MDELEHAKYGTPYIETEAILAAEEGDEEYIASLLQNVTETQKESLRAGAYLLSRRMRRDTEGL